MGSSNGKKGQQMSRPSQEASEGNNGSVPKGLEKEIDQKELVLAMMAISGRTEVEPVR